jgi:RNA polymerase sigma-70 factor, ECF subfamily
LPTQLEVTAARLVEQYFLEHKDMVFRVALRLLHDSTAARDATQETFVRALQFCNEGKVMDEPGAWLRSTVSRLSLDVYRRRRRWRYVPFLEPTYLGKMDERAQAFAETKSLERALRRLPPKQQAAVTLVDIEGLTGREAAAALACSDGALEQLLVRARTTLRKELSDGT